MLDDEIQTALDEAIKIGVATYEISKARDALILTVKNGHRLIPMMDKIFGFEDLSLVPNQLRSPNNATPILTIGNYVVGPKFRHKEINGYHEYELIYATKINWQGSF